jgi:uncharacterized protein YsxB (DUF464 family)
VIEVRVTLDDGCLSSLVVTGHASTGTSGVSAECAAVTGIVRAVADAIVRSGSVHASGGADAPGEMRVEVDAANGVDRDWLRGVTDVLVRGISRIADDAPREVRLTTRERGETHGT